MEQEKIRGDIGHLVLVFMNYLFMIVTILQCNSVFYRVGNHSNKVQSLWLLLLFFFFLQSFIKIITSNNDIIRLFLFLLFFSVITLIVFAADYQIMPVSKDTVILYLIAPIMLVVLFYAGVSFENSDYLLIIYKNIVLVLAVASLFFWLLSMLKVPTDMNSAVQWGGYRQLPGYFGLHYIAQGNTSFLGLSMVRNTGLFVEAPMYSYVLSIGLLVLLFVDKRATGKKRKEILLLLITIFTTTSTTGVIVALLAIAYDMLIVRNNAPIILKIIIVALGVLLAGVLIRIILLRKIQVEGVGSAGTRWNDIQAGYYAWKNHLWVGNGFGNYSAIEAYMDPSRLTMNGNSGFSSGFMESLAYGGILAVLFQVIPTILSLINSKKLFGLAVLAFVLFIFTLVNNVYIYTMLLSYIWTVIIFKNVENGSEGFG